MHLHLISIVLAAAGSAWVARCDDVISCPPKVSEATRTCLARLRNQLAWIRPVDFLLGADVEVIRSACRGFRESMSCAAGLKRKCTSEQHAAIEDQVALHQNMLHLCTHDQFYEVYARHQACFYKRREPSEACWKRKVTADCNSTRSARLCVEKLILADCGPEAESLVESLFAATHSDSDCSSKNSAEVPDVSYTHIHSSAAAGVFAGSTFLLTFVVLPLT